ncbi:MAG: CYTH domain-containing protein [Lachnospiraceae bacterium]|nr:CYTH domain-containing protein [Lachnospiraceae bacterium]
MEIEKKFLIQSLDDVPGDISSYSYHDLEQGYLCTAPVLRVRKEDATYYCTYKGSGMMSREEYNLPLTKEAYDHLIKKSDGIIITKRRYLIPLDKHLTCELDVFGGDYEGLLLAEVEFSSEEEALSFQPPKWFGEDVTFDSRYHNSNMSKGISK